VNWPTASRNKSGRNQNDSSSHLWSFRARLEPLFLPFLDVFLPRLRIYPPLEPTYTTSPGKAETSADSAQSRMFRKLPFKVPLSSYAKTFRPSQTSPLTVHRSSLTGGLKSDPRQMLPKDRVSAVSNPREPRCPGAWPSPPAKNHWANAPAAATWTTLHITVAVQKRLTDRRNSFAHCEERQRVRYGDSHTEEQGLGESIWMDLVPLLMLQWDLARTFDAV
jgi:hypothetical protein